MSPFSYQMSLCIWDKMLKRFVLFSLIKFLRGALLSFMPTNTFCSFVNSCHRSALLRQICSFGSHLTCRCVQTLRWASFAHLQTRGKQPFPFVSMCNTWTAAISYSVTQDYPSPPLASSTVTVVANGKQHLAYLNPLPEPWPLFFFATTAVVRTVLQLRWEG